MQSFAWKLFIVFHNSINSITHVLSTLPSSPALNGCSSWKSQNTNPHRYSAQYFVACENAYLLSSIFCLEKRQCNPLLFDAVLPCCGSCCCFCFCCYSLEIPFGLNTTKHKVIHFEFISSINDKSKLFVSQCCHNIAMGIHGCLEMETSFLWKYRKIRKKNIEKF